MALRTRLGTEAGDAGLAEANPPFLASRGGGLGCELASKLLVCGNGGNHLGCPVSFCRSGRYRFGVSFFRVPRIVLQWF